MIQGYVALPLHILWLISCAEGLISDIRFAGIARVNRLIGDCFRESGSGGSEIAD